MDEDKRGDLQILSMVAKKYMWGIPSIRRIIPPVAVLMVLSSFLEVMVADFYKKISKALGNKEEMKTILLFYSVIYISGVVLSELQSFIVCKAGQIANRRANRDAYRFFLNLEPESFYRFGKGEIQNIINRQSQAVQDIIDVFTLNFLPTILIILFVTHKVISNIGFVPALIINICIVLYAFTTIKITIWRNGIRRQLNKDSNNSANILTDGFMNYETVLIHNKVDHEVKKYDRYLEKQEVSSTRLARSMYLLNLLQKGIWRIQSILIITLASIGLFVSKIETEQLAFYLEIVAILIKTLDNLGFMYGKYKQALINIRQDVSDTVIPRRSGNVDLDRFSRILKVDNLTADVNGRIILRDVGFEVRRGEKVAVVGDNGSGKSTLIKLLLLLKKQLYGTITIDGCDIRNLTSGSLRSLISYVSQNTILFNETVLYNIKYGSTKVEDEEVVDMSRKIGFHENIIRLQNRYNTLIGEHGGTLSGGERQRISILRALISGGPILIMDEPTASLDKVSEEDIFMKLRKVEDLTVIAIVHNHRLLPLFDKLLVVEGGRVYERRPESAEVEYICRGKHP